MAVPKYCRQRVSGKADKAYCRVKGERHYLGIYNSPESLAKYAKVLTDVGPAQGQREGEVNLTPPTVAVVMAAYLVHSDTYYGHKSPMWYHIRGFMRGLNTMFGEIPANEFRALKLHELREHWVAQGWTRKYINAQVARLRRMFKWAVGREMLLPEVHHSLIAVDPLLTGKCEAHDLPEVAPVSDADVEATLPYLSEKVAVMVMIQRFCGCRPGELVRITKADIDRSGDVWTVDLARHKTLHHDKKRLICFGPKAQELLLPRLVCADEDRIFPMRRDSYGTAVNRACKRAGVPNWSPNQLRHSAGTEAREKMGLEAAQVHLGHSHADTTEIYAETSRAKAIEVARRIG